MAVSTRRATRAAAGLEPLSPQRKWRAIGLATLLLAPAAWSLLAGLVALAADEADDPAPAAAGAAIALGLCLIPFVFLVLAFASEHPRWPGAVLRAMGLCLLVGTLASAVAADAVTGIVAGLGAGGAVALRRDPDHDLRTRGWAVVVAALYCFVLARVAGAAVVVATPVLPFTALGVADHLAERRAERAAAARTGGEGSAG